MCRARGTLYIVEGEIGTPMSRIVLGPACPKPQIVAEGGNFIVVETIVTNSTPAAIVDVDLEDTT